jgi:hypothetical protein
VRLFVDDAHERAEELLRDSLSDAQYASYLRHGYVDVPSKRYPDRRYRVDGWRPVSVFEDGGFVGAVCIRSREYLPGPDVLLARKLMIEGAEDEFLRAGNWLQPAWRPAGTAPMLFVILALLSPWLLQLRAFGARGIVAILVVVVASVAFVRLRQSGRGPGRSASGRRPGRSER